MPYLLPEEIYRLRELFDVQYFPLLGSDADAGGAVVDDHIQLLVKKLNHDLSLLHVGLCLDLLHEVVYFLGRRERGRRDSG